MWEACKHSHHLENSCPGEPPTLQGAVMRNLWGLGPVLQPVIISLMNTICQCVESQGGRGGLGPVALITRGPVYWVGLCSRRLQAWGEIV